jgi:hypothetical protein
MQLTAASATAIPLLQGYEPLEREQAHGAIDRARNPTSSMMI